MTTPTIEFTKELTVPEFKQLFDLLAINITETFEHCDSLTDPADAEELSHAHTALALAKTLYAKFTEVYALHHDLIDNDNSEY
jgi:hypothetical protein